MFEFATRSLSAMGSSKRSKNPCRITVSRFGKFSRKCALSYGISRGRSRPVRAKNAGGSRGVFHHRADGAPPLPAAQLSAPADPSCCQIDLAKTSLATMRTLPFSTSRRSSTSGVLTILNQAARGSRLYLCPDWQDPRRASLFRVRDRALGPPCCRAVCPASALMGPNRLN